MQFDPYMQWMQATGSDNVGIDLYDKDYK